MTPNWGGESSDTPWATEPLRFLVELCKKKKNAETRTPRREPRSGHGQPEGLSRRSPTRRRGACSPGPGRPGQLQREDHKGGLDPSVGRRSPGQPLGLSAVRCKQQLALEWAQGAGPAQQEDRRPLPGTKHRARGRLCLNTREVNCLET